MGTAVGARLEEVGEILAGLRNLPVGAFVAETAIDDPGDDRRNVAALWELAGLREQAPDAEKGFSMLTAALKKKISENRKTEKQKARVKKSGAKESTAKKSKAKKRRG